MTYQGFGGRNDIKLQSPNNHSSTSVLDSRFRLPSNECSRVLNVVAVGKTIP